MIADYVTPFVFDALPVRFHGRSFPSKAAGGAPAPVPSLTAVGLLVARAALRREESRGAHFRTDFPVRDDLHWRRHVADRVRLPTDPR